MFELAREWGFLEENAGNPARGIKKFPEKIRDRYLKERELPALAQSIEQEPNIHIRSIFWLYLLTGLRKSELLQAKWDNLDFKRGVLEIGNTKSGRPVEHPLSGQAISIMRRLPKLGKNPYIFASPVIENSPLTSIHKNWLRIRKRAGLNDLRIHDLRRTVGSWMAQNEKNVHLVSKVLNHADISTTAKVYGHLGQTQVRSALNRHGNRIGKLVRI